LARTILIARTSEDSDGNQWAGLGVLVPAKTSCGRRGDFQADWWQFFSQSLTATFDLIVQSWDTAFKKGTENDFSVCTTWGVAGDGYYLLHLWRGRVEFPELKRVLAWLAEKWTPNAILVEDKASGQSLIQELKVSTALPLIPIKVDSDKQTRAQAVTPLIEAGKIFLPQSAPWVSDFVEEMACFPNGIHDDVVDATTQALNYLRVKPARSTIELGYSAFAPNLEKLDKEALWEKALRGYPMSPEEIERM
jgi:predicted phage terminase large subunit-like protein